MDFTIYGCRSLTYFLSVKATIYTLFKFRIGKRTEYMINLFILVLKTSSSIIVAG